MEQMVSGAQRKQPVPSLSLIQLPEAPANRAVSSFPLSTRTEEPMAVGAAIPTGQTSKGWEAPTGNT